MSKISDKDVIKARFIENGVNNENILKFYLDIYDGKI